MQNIFKLTDYQNETNFFLNPPQLLLLLLFWLFDKQGIKKRKHLT